MVLPGYDVNLKKKKRHTMSHPKFINNYLWPLGRKIK